MDRGSWIVDEEYPLAPQSSIFNLQFSILNPQSSIPTMNLPMTRIASALVLFCSITLPAFGQYASLQVPKQIQYQGRVATATGGAWAGTEGYFVFALVQGATVLWNNWQGTASPADPGTVSLGSGQVLTLPVNSGVFSIRLGDGSGTNQQIPATVFFDSTGNAVRTGVKLAVWFSPDDITFTRLSPDVEFTAVPFAMVAGIAEAVQARAVSTEVLADSAVTTAKIVDGTITQADLSPSLQFGFLPVGSVTMWWGAKASVPGGWEICDGSTPSTAGASLAGNKPNLVDRFPKGATSGTANTQTGNFSGGTNTDLAGPPLGAGLGNITQGHALTPGEIPAHHHEIFPLNSGSVQGGGNYIQGAAYHNSNGYGPYGSSTTGDNTGGGGSHVHGLPEHDNRPAFLEMFFIIRVK